MDDRILESFYDPFQTFLIRMYLSVLYVYDIYDDIERIYGLSQSSFYQISI